MRKEKGAIKIIHVLIFILGFIVGLMAVYFYKVNMVTNVVSENTVAENNEGSDVNTEINKVDTNLSDLDFAFMKLENDKKNMIYSPLSIKYGLSMLNEGADGNTKAEIEAVLKDAKIVDYENIENVLSLANSLFIKDTFTNTSEEFKTTLQEKYKAEVILESFASNEVVNKWVEDKTFGRIKDLISNEIATDPNLAMILINALAIDMKWEHDMGEVYPSVFTLDNGTEMDNVAYMSLEGSYDDVKYIKNDEILSVELPLKKTENGNTFSIVLIEPKEKDLDDYIEEFDTKTFDKINKELKGIDKLKYGASIIAPLFKYDYDLNLKDDMYELGIRDAFGMDANFAKMEEDGKQDLYLSAAIHKADIDFSNKGITAAAATAMVMSLKSAMPIEKNEPEILRFEKPFMYVIKDEKNNIWFVGTTYVPEEYSVEKYSKPVEDL